jgi:ATP-binding cassette, subfamily F, member 3
MLTISNLDHRIGARSLFENASAQISSGWKVGLIGRNGTGKSTLLKLIREEIERPSPDSAIRLSKGARLGWVAQEVEPSDDTILDVVLAADAERHALLQEAETARDPDRLAGWLDEWVFGLSSHAEYVEKLGDERWAALAPGEAWSEPVNYGRYG